jgi:redox-sensing transcriptional repressor
MEDESQVLSHATMPGFDHANEVETLTQVPNSRVPVPTLERLATYLRLLHDLDQAHIETVSSSEVERQTGINAAQFRKDLSYFGEFGKPGVGYNVPELRQRITRILKIDRPKPVILIGAGNLGSALVGYPGLKEHQFELVAVFDNNYGKIGRPLWNLVIQDIARLKELNNSLKARIAILAVPASAAQDVCERLVDAGIRAILNFAPVLLRVPEGVYVRNVSFIQELAVLSYHLSEEEERERQQNGHNQAGMAESHLAALSAYASADEPEVPDRTEAPIES